MFRGRVGARFPDSTPHASHAASRTMPTVRQSAILDNDGLFPFLFTAQTWIAFAGVRTMEERISPLASRARTACRTVQRGPDGTARGAACGAASVSCWYGYRCRPGSSAATAHE